MIWSRLKLCGFCRGGWEKKMGLVSGKVALVTGSGGGIGRATALKFAREGAKVIASDINSDEGNKTVALIKQNGGDTVFARADVTRSADVEALIASVVDAYGQFDCACNNAGIESKIAPIAEQSEDDFDRVMSVNVKGTFLCLKYEIAQMLKNGGGAIVNLASVAGLVGFPGFGSYVASKHAINGLTKNAALEYSKLGIRINSICPGGIETRMLDSLVTQSSGGGIGTHEMMDPLHPIGRIGNPDAAAESWLPYITRRSPAGDRQPSCSPKTKRDGSRPTSRSRRNWCGTADGDCDGQKTATELPPNIKEFSEITAVIFSLLYESFPVDRNLDPIEIAKALKISDINANLPSGRSFNVVLIHTLGLLIREGFVHSYGNIQRERCVLATKATAVMNVVPPQLKRPFATELNQAIQNSKDEGRLAALMGDFFGSFAGSFWKSMAMGG
jgi:NAD(P)-dependent dehydrogenase (short-subunit alcohol dehydrogenase family)